MQNRGNHREVIGAAESTPPPAGGPGDLDTELAFVDVGRIDSEPCLPTRAACDDRGIEPLNGIHRLATIPAPSRLAAQRLSQAAWHSQLRIELARHISGTFVHAHTVGRGSSGAVGSTAIRGLRREIHSGLQVVENWNSANTVLHYGKDGALTGPAKEHAETSMLALHLLQSALVYLLTELPGEFAQFSG